MIHLLTIAMTAALVAGQAADPPGRGAGVDDRANQGPNTYEARLAILEQALADFDAAVAKKTHGSRDAQQLYRKALAGFESLLQSGVRNGGLYYNVGNTYLRLGEVGKAIVNYRRALRLSPGNESIQKNLESARSLCRVQIPIPATSAFVETLFFWHFGTSLATRAKVALGGYVLFWLLILVRLFALRHVPIFLWTVRGVAAVTLIVGASVAWETAARDYRIEGVIIAEEVVLRKGNGEYYEPQLEQALSEGVEFRFLETREDVEGIPWYHIELRDGKNGWLRADQADVV